MAATNDAAITIRTLGVADLNAAQRLSEEVGWNQLLWDWRIFLKMGDLFGVDGSDGALLATGATLPQGRDYGWISMIIVTAAARHRGIARQVVGHGIETLTARGLVPGLDATIAGRAVYSRLGFRDTWPIARLLRSDSSQQTSATPREGPQLRRADPGDLVAITDLDSRAFGTDRRALLARLLEREPELAVVGSAGGLIGFLLARPGRTATQLGPLVAPDPQIALAMIDHVLPRTTGPCLIDLVDLQPELRVALEARGFAIQRRFSRMFYRRDEAFGDPQLAVAIAGPELG
jgi:ribosomal protein S18 acetylase RimI-like enzyme